MRTGWDGFVEAARLVTRERQAVSRTGIVAVGVLNATGAGGTNGPVKAMPGGMPGARPPDPDALASITALCAVP